LLIGPERRSRTQQTAHAAFALFAPARSAKVINRARDVWDQPVKKIAWKLHLLKEPKERVRVGFGFVKNRHCRSLG